jgi:putative pyruvate formate lyase activating enzyme
MKHVDQIRHLGEILYQSLESCQLCPHVCKVNRLKGETGICQATAELKIASFHPHFGEEKGLTGRRGSGTIFFSHCNLRCVYCQNYDISHYGEGQIYQIEDLTKMMLSLQQMGCHNINIVTPTHYLPHLLLGLSTAIEEGLTIPLVYNTSGYELPGIIEKLDEIVDIYLTDFKYLSPDVAERLSPGGKNYVDVITRILPEMHRQVGVARESSSGLISKGLMIRHLVLPGYIQESIRILKWIAQHLPLDTYINIMSQYHPCYGANEFPPIHRRLKTDEYEKVVYVARKLGFRNLDIQGYW